MGHLASIFNRVRGLFGVSEQSQRHPPLTSLSSKPLDLSRRFTAGKQQRNQRIGRRQLEIELTVSAFSFTGGARLLGRERLRQFVSMACENRNVDVCSARASRPAAASSAGNTHQTLQNVTRQGYGSRLSSDRRNQLFASNQRTNSEGRGSTSCHRAATRSSPARPRPEDLD